jgi:sporulation protein YlmC with PRC-barrel domain
LREVHVEALIGRRVRDTKGRVIGRIMSVRANREGGHCYVTEYLLGAAALLSRMGWSGARIIGIQSHREPKRVPWQLMDLSDPERPRTTVPLEELPK